MLEGEGGKVGAYAGAEKPVLQHIARLSRRAATGALGELVRDTKEEGVEVDVAAAAVEGFGEEVALVLEEGVPTGIDDEIGLSAEHGLELVVGLVAVVAAFEHHAQTQHGIDLETPVADAHEGGGEIPQELGAAEGEQGGVGIGGGSVGNGHEVETHTESQGADNPLAHRNSAREAQGGLVDAVAIHAHTPFEGEEHVVAKAVARLGEGGGEGDRCKQQKYCFLHFVRF